MDKTKLRVQAAGGLMLVALVGWPQFRSIRAITIWGAPGLQGAHPDPWSDPRSVDVQAVPRLAQIGFGSLAQSPRPDATRIPLIEGRLRRGAADTSPTATSLGGQWNGIVCDTRTSRNQPVPYARLVLRDTTTGRIEARATADQDGACTFVDVAPSGYVVDLIAAEGAVLASSELVTIQNGLVRQATVVVDAEAVAADPVQSVERVTERIGQPIATNSPQQ